MDAKMIAIVAVVAAAAIGGYMFFGSGGQTTVDQSGDAMTEDAGNMPAQGKSGNSESLGVNEVVTVETTRSGGSTEHTVEITDSGFVPSEITIAKGDTVTFVNMGGSSWPASNIHPTHTIYPGSDISKCGTGAAIFDACRGLAEGESFSFKFDEVGEWKYHDHLRASLRGTVTVQ